MANKNKNSTIQHIIEKYKLYNPPHNNFDSTRDFRLVVLFHTYETFEALVLSTQFSEVVKILLAIWFLQVFLPQFENTPAKLFRLKSLPFITKANSIWPNMIRVFKFNCLLNQFLYARAWKYFEWTPIAGKKQTILENHRIFPIHRRCFWIEWPETNDSRWTDCNSYQVMCSFSFLFKMQKLNINR